MLYFDSYMKAKKSKFRLFTRGLKLSLTNLWRNKFLSGASILVIATIVFIFNVILSINYTVTNTVSELNQKVDLTIYVQDKDDRSLEKFIDDVKKIEGVTDASLISKDDALDQVKLLHPETVEFLNKYEIDNPLPNSISISTEDPKYHEEIRNTLQSEFPNIISSINENNSEQIKRTRKISDNLKNVQNFADQIIFWIILVFMIGGALIIINALQVSIFSRQKELSVMRFIGASHGFIRLPYILEAIWYAILAVGLNFIMIKVLSASVSEGTPALELWTSTNPELQRIVIYEFLATIGLSIVSSFIAIQRHLHKRLL